jgi:hypothetical protein
VLAVFQRDIKLADIASLAGLLVAQDRITLKRLLLERRQVTRLNMLRPEQDRETRRLPHREEMRDNALECE